MATIIINKRTYTIDTALNNHFIYNDGTIRLALLDKQGNRKLAQFTVSGEFELWENTKPSGKSKFSRVNMRS